MYDIEKHLADLSAARWDDYKAALAKEAVYEEMGTHLRAQGADNYLKAVQRWKRAFPDLKAKIISKFASGDRAVAEVEWSGTQSGPLEGPFGTIAPTNRQGTMKAVIVATTKHDKVLEVHQYFDVLTMLGNLGVSPTFVGIQSPPAQPTAPSPRH